MEVILAKSARLLAQFQTSKKRYLYDKVNWENRLIGIKGARGVGKSTLLLQKLKEWNLPPNQASYWSLDDLFFTNNSLAQLASAFYDRGGRILFLDEVHKYENWSQHIKNLYDHYNDLRIVFTGSSIIDITQQEADLSRRALMYSMAGLSYREYLNLKYDYGFEATTLEEITNNNPQWQSKLPQTFRPLEHFDEYLQLGYYPFSMEDESGFHSRLQQVIRIVVEYDMSALDDFDIRNAKKLLQLLYIISTNVPFKPNISELARKTNIHRNTIAAYLNFLEQAQMIRQLYPAGISISILKKPEKIYLNNTNLAYALATNTTDKGNLRETFFASQLSVNHSLQLPQNGDFIIDNKWTFEIGGKNKSKSQLKAEVNAHVVVDDMDYPVTNLPLWIFGFLY